MLFMNYKKAKQMTKLTYTFMLFMLTHLAIPLFGQNSKNSLEYIEKNKILSVNDPDYVFIQNFWRKVIIERGLPFSMNFFCGPNHYLNNKEIDIAPEAIKEVNYANLKSLYHEDCSQMIDLLPKVHVDDIRLLGFEVLPEPNPLLVGKGKIYGTIENLVGKALRI
jgi:hypothetical protein